MAAQPNCYDAPSFDLGIDDDDLKDLSFLIVEDSLDKDGEGTNIILYHLKMK